MMIDTVSYKRFINELNVRNVIGSTVLKLKSENGGKSPVIIYDSQGINNFHDKQHLQLSLEGKNGLNGTIYTFNTLEELSKYFVLDYNKVKDAADSYNKLMAFGKDTEFNKDVDAMIGAQEPTILTSAKNILGIRHFYAGYQFNNNGSLVTCKMDAPSVLSAFFSEILDLDGGGNGFGGIGTGIRRFQIQYRTPFGLDFALIEYDLVYGRQTVAKAEYIPRVAVSYTYKKDGLYAKIAGTYGILNGELVDIKSANTNSSYGTVHAFHIGGAVKKIIGNFHFAVLASYGMNADLYNEQKTVYSNGGYLHQKLNSMTIGSITYNGIDSYIVDENGKISNVTRVSAYAEFGYKIVPSFSLIAGGGYQYTKNDSAE